MINKYHSIFIFNSIIQSRFYLKFYNILIEKNMEYKLIYTRTILKFYSTMYKSHITLKIIIVLYYYYFTILLNNEYL